VIPVELLLILAALVLLDLAAMRWGADTRDLRLNRPLDTLDP
jgi:hypothetical protein